MTNPPILVITGLGGYFILNFLQKSGFNNHITLYLIKLRLNKTVCVTLSLIYHIDLTCL